jgi:tRNA(Ile)-lysidine synthase
MAHRLPLPIDALPATGALVVGFSGGLDSSALLHALSLEPTIRSRGLRALHVDHGLHADADQWATRCERQAATWNLPLQVVQVQVRGDAGLGLEGAAREARYAALLSTLGPGEVLVTAHHQDDQAETFLLRALRASGPEGLGAMRPLRRFGPGWHWRPLLEVGRAHLLAYARAHGLDWIEDPSNAEDDPERNFLRLHVLPLLRQRWPHASQALARSASLSAQADALLADDDAGLLARLTAAHPQVLDVAALLAEPVARRARLLRLWVRRLGLPRLPARGLEQLELQVLGGRHDAQPQFCWAGARLLRWRQQLHAGWQREPLPPDWTVTWDGQAPLALPDGGVLSLLGTPGQPTCLPGPVRVAARRGGERIRLPGRGHSHALKQLLQAARMPPWERDHLPLLWQASADGELLAAGDRLLSARLASWLEEHGLRLHWQPPGAR